MNPDDISPAAQSEYNIGGPQTAGTTDAEERGAADRPAPRPALPPAAGANRAERDATLPQALARVQKIEDVIRNINSVQKQRHQNLNSRISDAEKTLWDQIAELELKTRQMVEEADAQQTRQIVALEKRIAAAEAARAEAEQRADAIQESERRPQARQTAYQQAWEAAPLTLRLRFVRELLPESHALTGALKEAESLEGLRRRGRDLENWLANYPSLFADAMQTLYADAGREAPDALDEGNVVKLAAEQTLDEACRTLETAFQALGLAWVTPVPGETVTADHEVVGEEVAPQKIGSVARLRRRGFRVQGRLILPAQVVRASAQSATADRREERPPAVNADNPAGVGQPVSPESFDGGTAAETPPTNALYNAGESAWQATRNKAAGDTAERREAEQALNGDTGPLRPSPEQDTPDWLRTLRQRTFGDENAVVSALVEQAAALVELPAAITDPDNAAAAPELLTQSLLPLLPLLGLRYADGLAPEVPAESGAILLDVRAALLAWLDGDLGVSVLSPSRGAAFDPETMEAVKTIRTAHAHEENTVKLERIGLLWNRRPLLRAEVVRYASGDNA